jgi:hypothetical protein
MSGSESFSDINPLDRVGRRMTQSGHAVPGWECVLEGRSNRRIRPAKHCPANDFSGLRNKALGTARLTERFAASPNGFGGR